MEFLLHRRGVHGKAEHRADIAFGPEGAGRVGVLLRRGATRLDRHVGDQFAKHQRGGKSEEGRPLTLVAGPLAVDHLEPAHEDGGDLGFFDFEVAAEFVFLYLDKPQKCGLEPPKPAHSDAIGLVGGRQSRDRFDRVRHCLHTSHKAPTARPRPSLRKP
ncbi:hypothetical protein [Rhizobium sp. G21]|uniref:hypothetical protein n=1 Tax=Rhizobium sp. G21 TaxID=2758439 RepID=UPI0016022A5E|nr:hypothetical protein [Rhizobium sp. G21]MBB1250007.1 hypothetical protein [Rhizobium sp. G21]